MSYRRPLSAPRHTGGELTALCALSLRAAPACRERRDTAAPENGAGPGPAGREGGRKRPAAEMGPETVRPDRTGASK